MSISENVKLIQKGLNKIKNMRDDVIEGYL